MPEMFINKFIFTKASACPSSQLIKKIENKLNNYGNRLFSITLLHYAVKYQPSSWSCCCFPLIAFVFVYVSSENYFKEASY